VTIKYRLSSAVLWQFYELYLKIKRVGFKTKKKISLHDRVDTGPGAHTIYYSIVSNFRINSLTVYLYLVPKSIMRGVVPPLDHIFAR